MNPETELFQQLCIKFLTLLTREEKRNCIMKMKQLMQTGLVA